MKPFILFCLVFFLSNNCHAQKIYNVETAPSLRTKSYSRGPYKNIVIFSAPRTGSSLIYNIFKFLFEEDAYLLARHDRFNLDRAVLRTHRFNEFNLTDKENTLCVFTFRNPIDAVISHYRLYTQKPINTKKVAQTLINKQLKYLLFSQEIEKAGQSIIRHRFEDSVANMDFIFELIENHFNISIDPKDKELMKVCYSKENIQACIKNLKDFNEYLPISGFHGKHVTLNKYVPPKDLLYWLNIYLEDVKPLFQTYGYFLDSSI